MPQPPRGLSLSATGNEKRSVEAVRGGGPAAWRMKLQPPLGGLDHVHRKAGQLGNWEPATFTGVVRARPSSETSDVSSRQTKNLGGSPKPRLASLGRRGFVRRGSHSFAGRVNKRAPLYRVGDLPFP
jgi:hypothetical protein